ncbi:MAG: hypothetical protein ABEH58_00720 [Haloplanus sp.]
MDDAEPQSGPARRRRDAEVEERLGVAVRESGPVVGGVEAVVEGADDDGDVRAVAIG